MSTEMESNPFRPDGQLSREAENIIKHSTILRDKVIINDPSVQRPENGLPHTSKSFQSSEINPQGNGSAPMYEDSPVQTGEVVSGHVSSPLDANATVADGEQPMLHVEHVKIKSGTAKCCLIL